MGRDENEFAEYEGVTAKELAATVARYGKALNRIAGTLSFPVSTEIDARGWSLQTPNEYRNQFAAETAIRALRSPSKEAGT